MKYLKYYHQATSILTNVYFDVDLLRRQYTIEVDDINYECYHRL